MPPLVKRVVIPLLLAVVVGGVILVLRLGADGGGSPEALVIEELVPIPEANILRQNEVGIDLITGWDASIVLNGRPIPDDELERSLELGRVVFRPGPDKVFESLTPGRNCVRVDYWELATGPAQSFSRSWCFNVL